MKLSRKIVCLVCLLLLTGSLRLVQAQIASADLRGTVYDPSQAVIPGATITVTAEAMGTNRIVATDGAGQYQALLLRPGAYTIKVTAANFEAQIHTGVTLTVGQILNMDFHLRPAPVETSIEVAAITPVVETEKTQQADTIEQQRIAELPINRRNFLDFALLTPGVTDADNLVDEADWRVAQTPHSGLSFAGSNGRRNSVSIDGASNIYNSGGVRPTLSQVAVQEFQISRSNYTAESGGATGGVINIVSKSGTNELHGELFGFFRHRNFQARNYFDDQKVPFTRSQAGFGMGGPLSRNRAFFFVGFERLDKQESARVPILSRDPGIFSRLTPSQSQLLGYLDGLPAAPDTAPLRTLAAALRPALLTTSYPRTISLFQSNSGIFPLRENQNQMMVKLDWNPSPNHQIFLRENWTDDRVDNSQFGALIAYNRSRTMDQFDQTALVSDTYILNPRLVHQLRLAWSYNSLQFTPLDPAGPEINIPGFGFFGRDIYLPSKVLVREYQLQDNLVHVRGRHTWKVGGEYHAFGHQVHSEAFFSGRFGFGEAIPLGSIIGAAAGTSAFLGLNQFLLSAPGVPEGLRTPVPFLFPGATSTIPVSAALASPITALQSYNLGLPTFYQQGFGNPRFNFWSHRPAFFAQDDWKVRPNFTVNAGVRYEGHLEDQPIGADINNFGPRIGFSWDPFSTGRTVLRGGYGIYFSPVDGQQVAITNTLTGEDIHQIFVPLTGLSGLLHPRTGQPLNSADIYQTLLSQGILGQRAIQPEDLLQFGIVPGPGSPFVLFQASKDYAIPYSQQASFAVERQIGDFSAGISYLFNRTARIPRNLDVNVVRTGTNPATGQPTYTFRNPSLLQWNQVESTANSFYHGMILSLNKQFRSNYSLFASYTLSKAIDETTDFNEEFSANDQTNLRAERGLSSFDQRHRLVLSGVFATPWEAGSGNHLVKRALADILVAPIVVASSSRPFNLLIGFDNVGDNHPTTHRPFGAGRNIGRGPSFFSVDLRISKRFRIPRRERWDIVFTAEGFNLLNRTNFKSLNNTVGDVRLQGTDLIDPTTGRSINDGRLEGRLDRLPTEPLGFTSTFEPRQFQLGLKISF